MLIVTIERIASLAALDRERAAWESLYARDHAATVFTSWPWMRTYLGSAAAPAHWYVLVARDGDRTLGYLPLAARPVPAPYLPLGREIAFAGDPLADYNGMLLEPLEESATIAAFAAELRRTGWDSFRAGDVADARVAILLEYFAGERGLTVSATGETRCPYVELPTTAEAYFASSVKAKTRGNTLRVNRKLAETYPAFRIARNTDAGADVDGLIRAMIAVNHMRWGGNLAKAHAKKGALFRALHDAGILRLTVYFDGDRPMAGSVAFVDDVKRTWNVYMMGLDVEYGRFSPGRGLIGEMIRDAIAGGYTLFDFLRGAETYKAEYCPNIRITTHHRVARRSLRSASIDAAAPALRTLKLAAARIVYGPQRQVES